MRSFCYIIVAIVDIVVPVLIVFVANHIGLVMVNKSLIGTVVVAVDFVAVDVIVVVVVANVIVVVVTDHIIFSFGQ